MNLTGTVPVLGDSISNNPRITGAGQPIWPQLLQEIDPGANYQVLARAGVTSGYVLNNELPLVLPGCSYAFATLGANDYNVATVAQETDWPTVQQNILAVIDALHNDCYGGPVVVQTYAYNFTVADIRYTTFARLDAFILQIGSVGNRPWVILVDQDADPRFHLHTSQYMLNDLHENAAGQYPMAQNIAAKITAWQAGSGVHHQPVSFKPKMTP